MLPRARRWRDWRWRRDQGIWFDSIKYLCVRNWTPLSSPANTQPCGIWSARCISHIYPFRRYPKRSENGMTRDRVERCAHAFASSWVPNSQHRSDQSMRCYVTASASNGSRSLAEHAFQWLDSSTRSQTRGHGRGLVLENHSGRYCILIYIYYYRNIGEQIFRKSSSRLTVWLALCFFFFFSSLRRSFRVFSRVFAIQIDQPQQ